MKRVKKILIDDSGEEPKLVFYTNDNQEYEAKDHPMGFYLKKLSDDKPTNWKEFIKDAKLSEVKVVKGNTTKIYKVNSDE